METLFHPPPAPHHTPLPHTIDDNLVDPRCKHYLQLEIPSTLRDCLSSHSLSLPHLVTCWSAQLANYPTIQLPNCPTTPLPINPITPLPNYPNAQQPNYPITQLPTYPITRQLPNYPSTHMPNYRTVHTPNALLPFVLPPPSSTTSSLPHLAQCWDPAQLPLLRAFNIVPGGKGGRGGLDVQVEGWMV